MRKRTILTLLASLLFAFIATMPAYGASEHGSMHTMTNHGDTAHDEAAHTAAGHESMSHESHENMMLIGDQTVDGVKATAHISDVRKAMAQAGLKMTHHLMILFTDQETQKNIERGTVAVKVTTPSGEVLPAQALMGMEGHFGADLTLSAMGTYTFTVGTKLSPDSKKRQFTFTSMIH